MPTVTKSAQSSHKVSFLKVTLAALFLFGVTIGLANRKMTVFALMTSTCGLALGTVLLKSGNYSRQDILPAHDENNSDEQAECDHCVLYLATIEALATAIDAKDRTSPGHVRRTQANAIRLGRMLGVSSNELNALALGSILHDIGKLSVSESLLNKPGKLTAAEFEKVKIHPVMGAEILSDLSFPFPLKDVVLHHHEKWDGSGYPHGLKGHEIPLVARIVSIVDSYDSARCDGPNKSGMSKVEALALMHQMSGTSFDPDVLTVFVGHIAEFDPEQAELTVDESSEVRLHDLVRHGSSHFAQNTVRGSRTHSPIERSVFETIGGAEREMASLSELIEGVPPSFDLMDTLRIVTRKLRQVVECDTCVIHLRETDSNNAIAVYADGRVGESFLTNRIIVGSGLTGRAMAEGRSFISVYSKLQPEDCPPGQPDLFSQLITVPLQTDGTTFGAVTMFRSGSARFSERQQALLDAIAGVCSAAILNAQAFERTRDGALNDPLTMLANSRAFHMVLEQRIAECRRGPDSMVAVLTLDVMDFKGINRRFGHGAGDRLLGELSALIQSHLRQMDILARIEGNRFAAILPHASNFDALVAGKRICDSIASREFLVFSGTGQKLELSCGTAVFPGDGDNSVDLLSKSVANNRDDRDERQLRSVSAAATVDRSAL